MQLNETCPHCAAPLAENDVGDGAIVFLIFFLGFLIIPCAWMAELAFAPPLWAHVVVWSAVSLAIIAVLMPALKAYIMLLNHRHRPQEWQRRS